MEDKEKDDMPEKPDKENQDPYDTTPESDSQAELDFLKKESEKKESKKDKKKGEMPFLDHLEEFRWRLIKGLISIAVLAIVSFIFADYVFKFLTMPLGDVKLYFTEITGSFYAYLKISFFTGLFLALPIIFYQLWKFVAPGLYPTEKKVVLPMVFFSTILFVGGAAFCFFAVLPLAISFLINYGEDVMNPIITVSSYISFVSLLIISFGVAFQLPVIGFFLGKAGIISGRWLSKARPYAIVLFLIAAAIITPPDVFTQILLAGPMYLLFELTIILVKITAKKKENS